MFSILLKKLSYQINNLLCFVTIIVLRFMKTLFSILQMKSTRGVRQNLPPISAKVPLASAPTPAKLVLTFNNTSRL